MVVARGWSWRSKYRVDILGPAEVHVVLHMTGGTPNYDGGGAVSPPPHMFLRAGSVVAGLRAPRTATPELREWRLTGGGASAVAWAVAARRASSAALRAHERSTPAALCRSITGRLFLEVRRVDRRLLLSCLSSSLSNVRWSPRLLGLASPRCRRRSSDDSLPARPLAASSRP